MTAIERTAYPRLKSRYNAQELDNNFTPTPADLAFADETTKDDETLRLGLLAQLKCFQHLGYFPAPKDVSAAIVDHLCTVMNAPEGSIAYRWRHTLYTHRKAVRRYLHIKKYGKAGEPIASEAIRQAAQTRGNPADLINAAIEELVRQRIELPAFSTLDDLTAQIRTQVNETWYRQLMSRLTEAEKELLKAFPKKHDEQSQTDFTSLKKAPGKPKLGEMRLIRDRLAWLSRLLNTQRLLADIPAARIAQFAAEARSLEPGDMEDHTDPRQFTLLCCFIHQAIIETRDHLIEIFLKRMRLIHQHAQEDLDRIRERQQELTERLIRFLGDIALQIEQISDLAALGTKVAELMDGAEGAADIRQTCEALAVFHDNNILPLLEPHYTAYRSVLFDMLDLLDIRATTQDNLLMKALDYIRLHRDNSATDLPAEISIAFASQRWERLVMFYQDKQWFYNHRKLELCVLSHIAADLRAGDLSVTGSQQYADIREQMLTWEDCVTILPTYCQQLGLPDNPADFVRHLKRLLARTARKTDKGFPENTQLSFDDQGRPSLKRIRKRPIPPEAQLLQRKLRELMPERHLLDVLVLVHRMVTYIRHFGPLSGSDPKLKDSVFTYLMTVFAFGSNIGAEETARNTLGAISARSISATNHQHVTAQKLDAGLVDIINFYTRFDLPGYWGPGKSAAADGTLIDLYENNLLSARHLRYGRYGGVAYYHIADNYIALFSHFIPVGVWEAVYIIDGLLNNDSQIQPDTLHADTQGQSLTVFGLTYLLGIQLMPRIRNWKDLVFYRPRRHSRYKHIDSLFTETIKWSIIERHWQDMMQVVISIQQGKLLPSALLRKLGHHTPKNKLYRAFRELGRVVRTIFLLRFVSDEPLQRQVTTTTNKVESYHNFRAWIAFGNQGEITSNDPVEMEKRIKYADLVANALILQNVVDIIRALHQLQKAGFPFNPEHLAFISPYWTRHIRRFGHYSLRLDLPFDDIFFDVPLTPARAQSTTG